MLSARAGEESRVEGMEAGADDYLIKPFSARELLARVAGALQMARMRREAEQALRQQRSAVQDAARPGAVGVYLVDADFRIREVNRSPAGLRRHPRRRRSAATSTRSSTSCGRSATPTRWSASSATRSRPASRTSRRSMPSSGSTAASPSTTSGASDRIPLPDGRNGVVCYFRDISAQVHRPQGDRREPRGAAGSRPPQGRVPGHARARAAQPAGPDPQRARDHEAAPSDGAGVEQARDTDGAAAEQLVRLVDDLLDVSRITPRQDRAAQGAGGAGGDRPAAPSRPAGRHGGGPRARADPSTLPDGADLSRRRPGAAGAGVRQPAQQRLQVHRAPAGASSSTRRAGRRRSGA